MPPTRPRPSPPGKPVRKIKILQIKKFEQKSLLSEHFYLVLGILFGVLTFFLMGFGLRWDESAIVSLWAVGILFVVRQVWRSLKGEGEPEKNKQRKNGVILSEPVKKYTPPELPRVSKDFSPMPPAGDKRYPPPSPFIKPPK